MIVYTVMVMKETIENDYRKNRFIIFLTLHIKKVLLTLHLSNLGQTGVKVTIVCVTKRKSVDPLCTFDFTY